MSAHSLSVIVRFTCNSARRFFVFFFFFSFFFGVLKSYISSSGFGGVGVGFFGLRNAKGSPAGRRCGGKACGIKESPPPVHWLSSARAKSVPTAGMSFGSAALPPPRWIGRLNVVKLSPAYSIIAYASICNDEFCSPLKSTTM